MEPSPAIQLWQPILSNTKDVVESVENVGITAGIFHRTSQTGSDFQQRTTGQVQPVTAVAVAEKDIARGIVTTIEESQIGQDI